MSHATRWVVASLSVWSAVRSTAQAMYIAVVIAAYITARCTPGCSFQKCSMPCGLVLSTCVRHCGKGSWIEAWLAICIVYVLARVQLDSSDCRHMHAQLTCLHSWLRFLDRVSAVFATCMGSLIAARLACSHHRLHRESQRSSLHGVHHRSHCGLQRSWQR